MPNDANVPTDANHANHMDIPMKPRARPARPRGSRADSSQVTLSEAARTRDATRIRPDDLDEARRADAAGRHCDDGNGSTPVSS